MAEEEEEVENQWLVFGLSVGDLWETKKRNAALSHSEGKDESL